MPCVDDSSLPISLGRAVPLHSEIFFCYTENASGGSIYLKIFIQLLRSLHYKALSLIFLLIAFPCHLNAQQDAVSVDNMISDNNKGQGNNPTVVVQVRTIKASKPKDSGEGESSTEIEIDSRLDDIRGKLGQINYLKYRLLAEDQLSVRIKRKHSMVLKDHTLLTVRPLYVEDEKVGMWLKWTDESGEQVLLDTRMHFVAGDSMIAGTDSAGDCGIILSIKAQKSNQEPAN